MGINPLDLGSFSKTAENIYEAIVVVSKRARQINDEYKIQMNNEIETVVRKSEEEELPDSSPDRMNISIKYEKLEKPTQKAVKEMRNKELHFKYKEFI
jgi:DNA-directed RNA polymerase subunit K/omega